MSDPADPEGVLRDAHVLLEREHRAAEEHSKEVSQIHDRLIQEVAERRVAEAQRDQFFSLSIDMLCISSGDGFFMCSGCRRIRDDEDGSWSHLERYLSKTKSGTQVSHGICPDCTRKLYPAYAQRMEASERGEKP